VDSTELAFAGIARQAALIARGEISARELVACVLERIERIDPQINAFRIVFSDQALVAAEQVTTGEEALPLAGVPIALKDDIDIAGEVTALGTAAHGPPVRADAEIVRRLRAAGAIVIGKTNVPELCQWPFTETPTWGNTRNPWDTRFSPGGSSGGSAAAVAAGLVGAAVGSDGAGSIRVPAAWSGIVGLKPTRGLIPTDPLHQPWQDLTVYGPLTRRVADAALLTSVLAGRGSLLAAAQREPPRLRIGISTRFPPGVGGDLDDEWRAALEQTAELLGSLGHEVSELEPDYGLGTAPATLVRYYAGLRDVARTLPHPERLERRTRHAVRIGEAIVPAVLARARAAEAGLARRVQRSVFDRVEILLTPAAATPPPAIGLYARRGAVRTVRAVAGRIPYSGAWNVTGHPAIALPVGVDRAGLPTAVQLVAGFGSDELLLSLAAQLEAAAPWEARRPELALP
jgi:amidase